MTSAGKSIIVMASTFTNIPADMSYTIIVAKNFILTSIHRF
jgi:hypothetical protein